VFAFGEGSNRMGVQSTRPGAQYARVLAQGPPLRYLPLASRAAVLPVRTLAPLAMEMPAPLPNAALVNKLAQLAAPPGARQRLPRHAECLGPSAYRGAPHSWCPSGSPVDESPVSPLAMLAGQVRSGQAYYPAEVQDHDSMRAVDKAA
jgi:hypothetical protein